MLLKKIYKKYESAKKLIFPNMANRMRLHYAKNYENKKIDPNLIVYETRDGNSIVDSPYAIFLYLVNNKEFNQFKHVWIINDSNDEIVTCIPEKIRDKVNFVYRNTLEYVDALLEGKYLFSNSTFESFFVKRPGQIYVNTWHGTPLKHMGFDIPGKVSHSQNVLRNFLMTDYILSPNPHTSNIFINSYKLHDIYTGKILEGGYPRIDLTLNSNKKEIVSKIKLYGTKVDEDKQTLLYSPTWKGSDVNDAMDDVEQIINETLKLVEEFSDQYNVLIKVHPFIFSTVKQDKRISDYLISDLVDANQVLSIVDILVTDYSSIFFDFLVTNKPIIFYAWDKDLYNFERGMYLDESDLPGPTAENLTDLISYIHNIDNYSVLYKEKYKNLAAKMVPYDDGKVTEKYVEYIFNHQADSNMLIREVMTDKKKLLIFPGGMRNNGITSSLLNLVNNIDYTLYDVTLICNSTSNNEINENLKSLNNHTRVLFRFGIDILTRKEKIINNNFADKGVPKNKRSEYPTMGYQREMNRLTANLKFDVAIDFSGYSYFWGRHILAANADKYVAFMHNDLMADSMREVNGEMPMYKDLHGLFSIYYQFDKLLSVSPMTRDVNLEKLSEYVFKEQMSFVYNSIDIDKILNSKKEDTVKDNRLNVQRRLTKPVVDGKTECYKNIDSIKRNDYTVINLSTNDNLIEHASFNYHNIDYVKVSINNVYTGWILKEKTNLRKIEVEKIEDLHGFGTVSANLNYPIWKSIKTNTDNDEIVTHVRYFKNRYLEIERVAYTNNGRYFLVKYNHNELGWMSPKPLMRVHKTFKFSPINQYFITRMSSQEKKSPVIYTEKIEEVLKYVRITNKKIEFIMSEPEGTTGELKIPFSEEYLDLYFKVTEIAHVNNNRYCKLTLSDDSFVGYISEEDIEYISDNEYDNQVLIDQAQSMTLPKVDLSLQKVAEIDRNLVNFVSMGRLSPEKNQKSLIEAFAKFIEVTPNSRLYILGMGPLKDELVQQIQELKLEGKVILLGHLKKPFEFMEEMSYFVLPSLYEGQPMVLLEALTIGMKILASNIPANINVIGSNEEYGLLTKGTSVNDILNGLSRIVSFENKFKKFNYVDYNKQAMQSFYREIE